MLIFRPHIAAVYLDPPYNHGQIQNHPQLGILPLGGQIVRSISFLNQTLAKWLA